MISKVTRIKQNEITEFDPLRFYKFGELCTYGGLQYRCLSESTSVTTPDQSIDWTLN